jgi:hypothetical protein
VDGGQQHVERDDLVPGIDELFHDVRTDESGGAGDQYSHAATLWPPPRVITHTPTDVIGW